MEAYNFGDAIPRRGNRFSRWFGNMLLRLLGWRITLNDIPNTSKFVMIGAPHTSNMDFVLTLVAMFALGIDFHWMGKHSMFKFPLGGLMRWLGGVPIDRSSSFGVVEQTVARFEASSAFMIAIMPEGTRRKVDAWKSGFYHIAQGAGVPILPVVFDYEHKDLRLGPTFDLSGDMDADIAMMQAFFADVKGRFPEQS